MRLLCCYGKTLFYRISKPDYVTSLSGLVAAENLALNKPIRVSSVRYFHKSNVNDGDISTGFATRNLPWSFAAVDLEDRYGIISISLRLSPKMRKSRSYISKAQSNIVMITAPLYHSHGKYFVKSFSTDRQKLPYVRWCFLSFPSASPLCFCRNRTECNIIIILLHHVNSQFTSCYATHKFPLYALTCV